jgi:hypothetical protein
VKQIKSIFVIVFQILYKRNPNSSHTIYIFKASQHMLAVCLAAYDLGKIGRIKNELVLSGNVVELLFPSFKAQVRKSFKRGREGGTKKVIGKHQL